jgi:hypothetical protein
MDNDYKVIIQKPEVRLFLQEEVSAFNKEQPETYNLEVEFAKAKKNRSPFIPLLMTGLFIIVIAATVGFYKYIDYQNRHIEVSVDVFEDVNLRKLLDMVSRTEESLASSKNQRTKIENERSVLLNEAKLQWETENYSITSMLLSGQERQKRMATAQRDYQKRVDEINTSYDEKVGEIDVTIADLKRQLIQYDSQNVERALQQQVAIDSQRQVFELEKERLTAYYEELLAVLRERNIELQQGASDSQRKAIAEVSQQYKDRIDVLDPLFTDELGNNIVLQNSEFPHDISNIEAFKNYMIFEEYPDLLLELESVISEYKDLEYISNMMASIPFENSMKEYNAAVLSQAFSAGEQVGFLAVTFVDKIEAKYQEILREKESLIATQKMEKEVGIQEKSVLESQITTYKRMESYFDSVATQSGDAGFILDIGADSSILVYLSPLYKDSALEFGAYVFRNSNQIIDRVSFETQGSFIFAIPANKEATQKMKVGDRLLLDIVK